MDINSIKLSPTSTIKDALKIIDNGSIQMALIVDENGILLGTISDGDIRRALLSGMELNSVIENIFYKTPIVSRSSQIPTKILNQAKNKNIRYIPILDENGVVIDIKNIYQNIATKPNKVILMAGGLGTRLRPLTNEIPKPMLNVGNKPILQTIIESFVSYGYSDITICVNYKLHIIKDYFKDGSDFGASIEYIDENKRLGTAGALSLIKPPSEEFFVMNADLLTNVNFSQLHSYHTDTHSIATMCVREYEMQIPYGVVGLNSDNISSIIEKPNHKFHVSAGIYMLCPEVLDLILDNQYLDMPDLFTTLIEQNRSPKAYLIHEKWLDIGRIEEYNMANELYSELFS